MQNYLAAKQYGNFIALNRIVVRQIYVERLTNISILLLAGISSMLVSSKPSRAASVSMSRTSRIPHSKFIP